MMDEVDTLEFVAMSVLAALSLTELVSMKIVLGLFVIFGLATGFVRYHRGKNGWRSDGCCFPFRFPRFRLSGAGRSSSPCSLAAWSFRW